MAINAGTVLINVAANVGPFRTQMLGLGGTISSLGSKISRLGVGLTRGLSLPLALAGGAAVKLAVDFDTAMTRIAAITGAKAPQIKKWQEDLTSLSEKTATDVTELADALYYLASAGLDADQVMPTLKASAKAAAAGLGSVTDVANITVSALNAYSNSGLKAKDVTDILVAAVREGRAEPEEFAGAMGRLLPIASRAKVEFNELAASLSVVSNVGLDVNEGVTAMRGLLQAIVAPGTQAKDTLKEIGVTSIELRRSLAQEGLLGTIRDLEEQTRAKFGEGWLDAMRKIVPNIRALTGEFALTGQQAAKVDAVFQKVLHSTGDTDKAFERASKGAAFQFRQALVKLKNVAIEFGNILIPILIDVVGYVEDVVKWFGSWSDASKKLAVEIGLALVVLGPLVRLLGGLVSIGSLVVRGVAGIAGAIGGIGTSAAVAGEQLTLFGGEAAAAGAGLAGPIAVGAALVAGSIGYVAYSIHSANQEVDDMVEGFRSGTLTADKLTESNKALAAETEKVATATTNQGLSARFAAPQINANSAQIDQNNEAIARSVEGYRQMSESFGANAREQSVLASIFKNTSADTETYRHHIAALVGAYHIWGTSVENVTADHFKMAASLGHNGKALDLIRNKVSDEVFALVKGKLAVGDYAAAYDILTANFKDNTLQQVKNLLRVGDTQAAYRLLKRDLAEATEAVRKNHTETAKSVTENRNLETAMKIAAGTGRSVKSALHDIESASKSATGKVKDTTDKLKDLGKQNPKPKVNIQGADTANRTASTLQEKLNGIVANSPYNANIHLTTTGGSTGFHLLEELEKAIRKITDNPWHANVHLGLDPELSEVKQGYKDYEKQLKTIGEVADKVFAFELPKAYDEQMKAFRKMVNEQGNELEKMLKKATKDFEKLQNKIKSFKDSIKSGFTDVAGLISGAVEGLNNVKGAEFDEDGNMVAPPVTFDLGDYLATQVGQAQEFATKLAQLAAAGLAPKILAELAAGGQQSLPLVDALLAGGKGMIDQFEKAQQTINQFANATADALSEEKFGGAVKRAAKAMADLKDKIQQFNNDVKQQTQHFIEALKPDQVNQAVNNLISALGSTPKAGKKMAAGGIVTKRTNIIAGEAGPEAIIPLDKAGVGGNVTVNLTVKGNAIYAQDLAEEVRSILLRDKRHKGALGLA